MRQTDGAPQHKDDFTAIYNLEEPSPYYAGLAPCNYRMPDVLAGLLVATAEELQAARNPRGRLKILDFACGYGANAALLRHQLRMRDLYRYYAGRRWSPADARVYWAEDRAHFAARRRASPRFDIAGLDIAENAVAYGLSVGLIDAGFTDDLVSAPAGTELGAYLAEVDLIIESGALGPGLPNAFANVLADADERRRPWFLYCPRPDVDWNPLAELWAACGYRAVACNSSPIRYRRALSEREAEEMLRDGIARGRPAHRVMADDYLLVDLMLARPLQDIEPGRARLEEQLAVVESACD